MPEKEAQLDTGHITLRSFCGAFDESFIHDIHALEQRMIEKGLDPSEFAIEKNYNPSVNSAVSALPLAGPVSNTYTIYIANESFDVIQYNDMCFLEYFSKFCLEEDAPSDGKSLLERCIEWFKKDSF